MEGGGLRVWERASGWQLGEVHPCTDWMSWAGMASSNVLVGGDRCGSVVEWDVGG